jgi:hypothetical protein
MSSSQGYMRLYFNRNLSNIKENGWIVALIIDFTIIGIDSFDSILTDDSGRNNENDSVEVASRNIAKISLVDIDMS